jgi:anti-sigma factor RsiW
MDNKTDMSKESSRIALLEKLRQKSIFQLTFELHIISDVMTEFDFDVELVEAYLDVLQEKDPVYWDIDEEKSYQEFIEKYSELYEAAMSSPPKLPAPKKRFRLAGAIAAAACLVFAIIFVPIDAYGNSALQKIVRWGDGVLEIRSLPPGGLMSLPADSGSEYRSLADALKKNNISPSNCPTWIPAGFALVGIETTGSGVLKGFVATYRDNENIISISVHYSAYPSATVSAVEKDAGGSVYLSRGQVYYILTSMGVPTAVWTDDNSTYVISGDITTDDLQMMIDSIIIE